jgi:hypothetical protein
LLHEARSQIKSVMVRRLWKRTKIGSLSDIKTAFKVIKFARSPLRLLFYLSQSRSQNRDDLIVFDFYNYQNSGFFVEIGCTDGELISNTKMLEELGWSGVIFEPNQYWHRQGLEESRLATVTTESEWVNYFFKRKKSNYKNQFGMEFEIEHYILNDGAEKCNYPLFKDINLPPIVEFLSIDIEINPIIILQSLPLKVCQFKLVSYKHNYYPNWRNAVAKFLFDLNYVPIYQNEFRETDWYLFQENGNSN